MAIPIDGLAILLDYLKTAVVATASGTLAADITATDAAITLGAGEGASFPADQNSIVQIDSEFVSATRVTDTLTREKRGVLGTTASAHTAGATVDLANFSTVIGSTNIYVAETPKDYNAKTTPGVVFWTSGGLGHAGGAQVLTPQVSFRLYPGNNSKRDAGALGRMLWDRLQGAHVNATNSQGRLFGASQSVPDQPLRDPETHWPFVLAIYDVKLGKV